MDVDLVELMRAELVLQRTHVSDHLQGHKARQDGQHQPLLVEDGGGNLTTALETCRLAASGAGAHLSLVLLLQFKATLDAAPRLQENLPLRVICQVVDEQACRVHTQVQQAFGKHLQDAEPG